MGIFHRLLGRDPLADLERAERRLADGDPVGALELARRFTRHRDPVHRDRASSLTLRARDALVASTLKRASAAEAAGHLEDAADWLQAALQHVRDGTQKAELEVRLEALSARAEAAAAAPQPIFVRPDREEEAPYTLDLEEHYAMLVEMLDEGVAQRYAGRSPEFQRAWMELNEGRAAGALEVLEEMAARQPGDPVLLFERGRGRLLEGRFRGAREDFEAVWGTFGDRPFDLAGTLTVPGLWAEAALGDGDAGAVLERLRQAARPDAGNPDLSSLYAQALMAAGRLDEARRFLAAAGARYPGRPDFPHLLAVVLVKLGEPELAIHCLESAIAPSCATGNCARPPLHLPSLRMLAGLYLSKGGSADRVRELMLLVADALGGRLSAEDHRLLAGYHRQTGDEEAAARAEAEARRLATAEGRRGRDGGEAAPDLTAGSGAVL